MKTSISMGLAAAALLCGVSTSAMADDWVRIGAVDVSHGMDRDTNYARFGGGVDRLRLDVRDSDVRCRSVRATFANGSSSEIFRGRLRAGRGQVIDLPGDRARVRKIDFACRADRRSGATIAIFAEVNTYRDEWRRSPDWDRSWSRIFNWGPAAGPGPGYGPGPRPGGPGPHHGWNGRGWNDRDWVSVATQSFEGRNDREVTVAGWRGRNVERIALRALNGDARCSRVTVRYNNGRSNDLNIDRGMRLEQGRGYSFDLPGRDRDVRDVMLHCSPVDGRSVRIEVLARK